MIDMMKFFPDITGEEYFMLTNLCEDFSEQDILKFSMIYRSRRRDPIVILVASIIGFMGIAGIQRFLTGSILLGILYFFTCGLCFIGTIFDIINYQQMALNYNTRIAYETKFMIDGKGDNPYKN